jgi:hypothetical protein
LQASHVYAVGLIAALFLLINFPPLWHTDIWGHLKFGQWMAHNRCLPERDPLCPFADVGVGFIHYSWLGQTGLYVVYHLGEVLAGGDALARMEGGVALLRFGHAVLVALRCIVLLAAFRRLSSSMALAVTALVVLLVLSVGNIAVLRPQVLGEFFFACILLALSRPVLSRRALAALPLLLVVWANAHGSFAGGFLLLAAAAAGRMVETLRVPGCWSMRGLFADTQLRRLVLVGALATLAVTVLNPSGPRIYLETLRMTSHPNVVAMDEWQPLRFHLGGGGHWAYLATLVLLAGTQFGCRRWFSATIVIFIIVFGVPPVLRQRMLIWWLMLAPWLIVRFWPACIARWRGGREGYQSVPGFRKTLAAGTLIVLGLLWSIPGQWLIAGQPAPLEQTLSAGTPWRLTCQLAYPDEARSRGMPALQKLLDAHYPQGRFRGFIFASETLGDLVVWELANDVPVFIYTHVHLFTREHWQRCLAVRSGSPAWRAILERYRVNLVLVEPDFNPRLCTLLQQDPGWQVLVDDRGDPTRRDPRQKLFIAVRLQPR